MRGDKYHEKLSALSVHRSLFRWLCFCGVVSHPLHGDVCFLLGRHLFLHPELCRAVERETASGKFTSLAAGAWSACRPCDHGDRKLLVEAEFRNVQPYRGRCCHIGARRRGLGVNENLSPARRNSSALKTTRRTETCGGFLFYFFFKIA